MERHLESAITGVVKQIELRGKVGSLASLVEVQRLEAELALHLPTWFQEFLMKFPIGGVEFGIPSRHEEGETDWLQWSRIEDIISESVQCYPGIPLLEAKWVNVAGCSLGSGDPYFISLEDGDNPPLYQVFHERYRGNYKEVEGFQYEQVSSSLADFFTKVIID